jgi:N-acetylmuramoyl-L-alanine amidase
MDEIVDILTTPRKIFISAGHSNVVGKDEGAVGLNGIKEGDLTVDLRKLIVEELILLGQHTITDPDYFVTKDTVTIINVMLESRDIAVDIHFNAFSFPGARGTEVLVPFKASDVELQLAEILSENISAVLATTNRGVKTEAQSARGRLIFMTPKCENILIEVCFITNKYDLISYFAKEKILAKVIAKCLYDFLTK